MGAKLKLMILGGLALFIAGAAAAQISLVARIWDPQWNPFRPSFEKVVLSSFEKLKHIETVKVTADFLLESKNTASGDILLGVNVRVDQTIDARNKEDIKTGGQINGGVSLEGVEVSFAGDLIFTKKEAYVKFTKIPLVPILSEMLGIDTDALKSQWILLEVEDLNSREMQDEYSKVARGQLIEILKDPASYTIEELADERIDEEPTYHYRIKLNQQALKKILNTLQQPGIAEVYVFDEEVTQSLKDEEFLKQVGDIQIEFWFGSKDYLLRRVFFEKTFESEYGAYFKNAKQHLNIDVRFSNFNKETNIVVPTDAKTFEEVIEAAQQSSFLFAPIRMKARDTERFSDVRQMNIILELVTYYATGPQFLVGCTTPYADVSICSGPSDVSMFQKFIDPSTSSSVCKPTSKSTCQYSISSEDGKRRAKTNDYQICFYLEEGIENGPNPLPRGLHAVKTDVGFDACQ